MVISPISNKEESRVLLMMVFAISIIAGEMALSRNTGCCAFAILQKQKQVQRNDIICLWRLLIMTISGGTCGGKNSVLKIDTARDSILFEQMVIVFKGRDFFAGIYLLKCSGNS